MQTPLGKFGIKQVLQPTPVDVKNIFHTILVISGVIAVVCQVVTEIPPKIDAMVSHILLEVNTLVFIFSRMFGIPVQPPAVVAADSTNVPTNDRQIISKP